MIEQILNFVKDIYVVGKKRPEMIAKVPNAKVVLFISNQSLYDLKFDLISILSLKIKKSVIQQDGVWSIKNQLKTYGYQYIPILGNFRKL